MSIIRILPEELASQIAAGEVVERPSSVVKELLENSIDSGATNIEVRISNGGKRRIKIIDNGVGMSRDDLILCVERHATSKILSLADLYSVRTLGFRGEALSSIASVARLKIQSRLHDRIEGHAIAVEGCKFLGVQEIGCPPGTNIEVRDLFFNVPARKKFLRGDRVETDHILDVFERIILPYPQIRFVMESEEKDSSMVYSASDDPVTRIAAVIGKQVAETMESLEISAGEFSMTAYLGAGEMARPRADNLYTYLNGRFIRDRLLTRAVLEGYSSRIIKGHYPQCVVFVNAPPGEVDVNVHPAKQEVRFRDAHSMFGFIAGGIAKTLSRKMFPASSPPDSFMEHRPYTEPKDYKYSAASEHRAEYLPASGTQTISGQTVPHEGYCDDLPVVIGQLNGTYVLCESRDGLLLIDQHAAHERIIYETLKSHLSSSSIPTQSFLVPQQIELSFREAGTAQARREDLMRLGFDLEHFGGHTFLLRSCPAPIAGGSVGTCITELLQRMEEGTEKDDLLDGVLSIMACHGAIRANHDMRMEEMNHLLFQLKKAGLPSNCPHGRPIFILVSYREIEKMFKRVV